MHTPRMPPSRLLDNRACEQLLRDGKAKAQAGTRRKVRRKENGSLGFLFPVLTGWARLCHALALDGWLVRDGWTLCQVQCRPDSCILMKWVSYRWGNRWPHNEG